MAKVFGLPIVVSILLGVLFPYFALRLMPLAFVFLFLLMVWAGFTIEWRKVSGIVKRPQNILVGLLFLYVLFPLGQWAIARLLIHDRQILYGLVFASLTPVAIVAPFFTNVIDGDEEFSFLLLVASMILCPIITPFLLKILVGSLIPINTWPLFKNMLFLITLPLLISFLVATFLPRVKQKFAAHLSILNMGSLSILIFILWGTAIGRLNLSYTTALDVSKILLLVFIQDFGVLFVSRLILFRIYDQRTANALVVSLSMKNVAIAAGILLFYDPKASFPAALAFIAHAFLFNFIPLFKRIFIPVHKRRQA